MGACDRQLDGPAAGQRAERVIGVGTNSGLGVNRWQSPDLPSPTIICAACDWGGAGWILVELIEPSCIKDEAAAILPSA